MRFPNAIFSAIFISLCCIASCSHPTSTPQPPVDTTTKIDTTHKIDTTKPVQHDSLLIASYTGTYRHDTDFTSGIQTGTIIDADIPEASGAAASRHYPNMLWTHNDSGNPNDIFLIDSTGKQRGHWFITNANNRDWEDICIGPGPVAGVNYIYLGDIGDNSAHYTVSYVYRFPEPSDSLGSGVFAGSLQAKRITFRYDDGPHNTETLMLDPITKDLYVATKENSAEVFRLPYPQTTDSTMVLYPCAKIPISKLTGGDISPDGTEVLMRTNGQVFYWKHLSGETYAQTLLRQPILAPTLTEPQGEGVCWSPNADAYWTDSEFGNGSSSPIHKFYRK